MREEAPWQCLLDVSNPVVTDETTVDSEPSDTGSTTDECGSPYHSESEQGYTTSSSPNDYSDSESQLSEASTEVQPLGSKKKM